MCCCDVAVRLGFHSLGLECGCEEEGCSDGQPTHPIASGGFAGALDSHGSAAPWMARAAVMAPR